MWGKGFCPASAFTTGGLVRYRLQAMAAGYSPAGSGPPFGPQEVISTCGMDPSGRIVMGSRHPWRE